MDKFNHLSPAAVILCFVKSFNCLGLFEHFYSNSSKLKNYLHIITQLPLFFKLHLLIIVQLYIITKREFSDIYTECVI